MTISLTTSLAATLVFAAAASADVLVVDDVGPFPMIRSAVMAAADGDTILKRGTLDDAVVLDGIAKSLTIVVDEETPDAAMIGNLTITNFAAGHELVIRGLDTSRLVVVDAAGTVVLEDCTFVQPLTIPQPTELEPNLVDGCAAITFTRCTGIGRVGTAVMAAGAGLPGFPGIIVEDSHASFYNCTLLGGQGSDAQIIFFTGDFSTPGGPGLLASDATVLMYDTDTRGGRGGDGDAESTAGCLPGADGGDGLVSTSSDITLLATVPAAGVAGETSTFFPCFGFGIDGEDIVQTGGSIDSLAAPARNLEASAVAREGDNATLTITGDSAELVLILFSSDVAGVTVQGLGGALLPGTPLLTLDVVLPPTGELSLTTPVPAGILGGADGAQLHLQVLGADPLGGGLLGSGSTLTLLSASL